MPDTSFRSSPGADAFQPRILIVPSSSLAQKRMVGGGERYALEYARAMAASTPTTHALFDTVPAESVDGPLQLSTLPIRRIDYGIHFPLTAVARKSLRRYDLIHLMCFPTPVSDLLLILARWRGQKVVLTDVGGGSPCYSTHLARLNGRFDLSRQAHGLAHLSAYAGSFFSNWPQPQTVLFGGASAKVVGRPQSPGGYALFVGRLFPHKGVLQLIQAIPRHIPLHVVGRPYDVAYFQQLQAAAAGKEVCFLTDADDATVLQEYSRASVVLQPSIPTGTAAYERSELLGLVALEAMASGKPVIVTSITSLPELVVDGETGYIVPPHDLPALADRIQRFIADPALSERMGAAGARHVQAHFTWKETAARGLRFYRQILGG